VCLNFVINRSSAHDERSYDRSTKIVGNRARSPPILPILYTVSWIWLVLRCGLCANPDRIFQS
jgi:hypothetical protein